MQAITCSGACKLGSPRTPVLEPATMVATHTELCVARGSQVIGDPANLEFTELAMDKFGWQPKLGARRPYPWPLYRG